MRTDEVPLQVPEGLADVQKKLKGINSSKRAGSHLITYFQFLMCFPLNVQLRTVPKISI